LIVGSRGVGKTTLFRYLKQVHHGLAVHISLATELASLTKQAGLGPLSTDCPPEIEPLVIGKATALLALSLVQRLSGKGLSIPHPQLRACLPDAANKVKSADLVNIRRVIATSPLPHFAGISETRPLPELVNALGESSVRHKGPLLLLLDRADMVLTPALVPVIELLDQSGSYIALVAMRPGHAGETLSKTSETVLAGDHYGIVHLGVNPRSEPWKRFMAEAIEAQLGDRYLGIAEPVRGTVLELSRDSIKPALEVLTRYLGAPPILAQKELIEALEDARENLFTASQSMLQRYHPDYRSLVNSIRDEVVSRYNTVPRSVTVLIKPQGQPGMFDGTNRLSRFVELALRCGAVCMPEGTSWSPGLHPLEVEVPPLLLWRASDELPGEARPLSARVARRESEFLNLQGAPPKPPSIFVAYRFNAAESKTFRVSIERAVRSHPSLAEVRVRDGHLPAGTQWPEAIRTLIRTSRAVLGDVTGMRPDVLFELGFAYGLGKTTIPVISRSAADDTLPTWLGATQLGYFGSVADELSIVTSILSHFLDPEFSRPRRSPTPIPGLAVWIRSLDWNADALDKFKTAAGREGLSSEVFGDGNPDESVLHRAASANLLVVNLDGTSADALMHYVCGAVIAKPKAGYKRLLPRKILVLEQPHHGNRTFLAESLKRCHETVIISSPTSIGFDVQKFGEEYRKWASSTTR